MAIEPQINEFSEFSKNGAQTPNHSRPYGYKQTKESDEGSFEGLSEKSEGDDGWLCDRRPDLG